MRLYALLALLGLFCADDTKKVARSIYHNTATGKVVGKLGDSYATDCPLYKKDFPENPEKQCGVTRRKCVEKGDKGEMEFEQASLTGDDEPCKPIRWTSWSPPSQWYCRNGIETRCQTRTCGCRDSNQCYDYFQDQANRRRPQDFTSAKCDPDSGSTKKKFCHDFNDRDQSINKSHQKQCESRPKVCHCAAEENVACPHCGTTWPRTAAGASAEVGCGCGYRRSGRMTRKCQLKADKCGCEWADPVSSCEKIEWGDMGGWDRTCPKQCKPRPGRVPESIYRTRKQQCKYDEKECNAAVIAGCLPERKVTRELCRNYKDCECIETTSSFHDPIPANRRVEAGQATGGNDVPPQPASRPVKQPKKEAKSSRGTQRSSKRSVRSKKGKTVFSQIFGSVSSIFKNNKRTRRRKRNSDRRGSRTSN